MGCFARVQLEKRTVIRIYSDLLITRSLVVIRICMEGTGSNNVCERE